MTCVYNCETICHPQSLFMLLLSPSHLSLLCPLPRKPLICFLSLLISLHFIQFYRNGILQYVHSLFGLASFFWDYYFEIHPYFSHIIHSFFLISEFHSIVWVYHHLFIRLLLYGCLGHCQFLATTNKVAINIHMQIFV